MKTTKNLSTAVVALATLEQAVARVAECVAAEAAAQKAHTDLRAGGTTPSAGVALPSEHRLLAARRETFVAKQEQAAARELALRAGCGATEEAGHPGRFAVVELRQALEPLVARRLELEAELAQIEVTAQEMLRATNARREEVAADSNRPKVLGPVAPVHSGMWSVLSTVAKHRSAGRRDREAEQAVAAAAGWCHPTGGGAVPNVLIGRYDELVSAALVGALPAPLPHAGQIAALDREIARVERAAADHAAKVAEEKAEREESAKWFEQKKRDDAARQKHEREAWTAKVAAEKSKTDALRDEGRRMLEGGTLPQGPSTSIEVPKAPSNGWRTL